MVVKTSSISLKVEPGSNPIVVENLSEPGDVQHNLMNTAYIAGGLENASAALAGLFNGRSVRKQVVLVSRE
ncbi:hypothetical protein Patl1_26969 [Pistacia atlantica]|uniref:Uncharacterized protein n=1 Tax=Pistacia atlantica TaxID=434234 RepID=A0ACC1AZA3_9ROSI|nr:hypothetical protein Patl1_26969 [Pistacia atlantica]